jgi:hypothetical protein
MPYRVETPNKLELGSVEHEKVDIWVSSFLAADLPKTEKKRKNVVPPKGERSSFRSN